MAKLIDSSWLFPLRKLAHLILFVFPRLVEAVNNSIYGLIECCGIGVDTGLLLIGGNVAELHHPSILLIGFLGGRGGARVCPRLSSSVMSGSNFSQVRWGPWARGGKCVVVQVLPEAQGGGGGGGSDDADRGNDVDCS